MTGRTRRHRWLTRTRARRPTPPCRLCGLDLYPEDGSIPEAKNCQEVLLKREGAWDFPSTSGRRELGQVVRRDRDCFFVWWVYHDGRCVGNAIRGPKQWWRWWALHLPTGGISRTVTLRGAVRKVYSMARSHAADVAEEPGHQPTADAAE